MSRIPKSSTLPTLESVLEAADAAEVFAIMDRMQAAGHWGRIESPFEPGQLYTVGFTPHLTTGWNGRMDHRAMASTPLEAAREAERKFLAGEADL